MLHHEPMLETSANMAIATVSPSLRECGRYKAQRQKAYLKQQNVGRRHEAINALKGPLNTSGPIHSIYTTDRHLATSTFQRDCAPPKCQHLHRPQRPFCYLQRLQSFRLLGG